jgi:hypothetical protein
VVCAALPAQVTGLVNQVTGLVGGLTGVDADLVAKQDALSTSINDLVAAFVSYVQIVNNGGNVAAAGQILSAKNSVFADKVVAENNAMTTSFEAHRTAYLTKLAGSYMGGIDNSLCGIALPSLPALPGILPGIL